MEVEGKRALVVDGTSGVGYSFAEELLKMNAAKVVITGLDEQTGAKAASDLNECYGSGRVDFCRADVTNPSEIENTFKYIINHFGALDIFFNDAETHEGRDVIKTNLDFKIQGIILACQNMTNGSVIVNHTSALGLDPSSEMIAHSAASASFLAASVAFGKNKYFKKTEIRMTTLCSEFISPISVGSTAPFLWDGQDADRINMQLAIAKSAALMVKYGPNNALWLCQRSGILSTVELQTIGEFIDEFEPKI